MPKAARQTPPMLMTSAKLFTLIGLFHLCSDASRFKSILER